MFPLRTIQDSDPSLASDHGSVYPSANGVDESSQLMLRRRSIILLHMARILTQASGMGA